MAVIGKKKKLLLEKWVKGSYPVWANHYVSKTNLYIILGKVKKHKAKISMCQVHTCLYLGHPFQFQISDSWANI